jgi:hypothetical protein
VAITIPLNQRLSVSITSLVPPSADGYRQGASGPRVAYRAASGWNVYVGLPEGPLYLQNSAPILLNSSYTLPGSPVLSGAVLDAGQVPDAFYRFQTTIQRT